MPGSPSRGCPRCRGTGAPPDLTRVRRRFIDRLISLVRLQYRYRCRSMGCGWEGSFPAERRPGAPPQ